MSFKRVRVNNTKKSEQERLYDVIRDLKGKEDDESKEKMDKAVKDIAEISENKYHSVVEGF